MAEPTRFDQDKSYRHRELWNTVAKELGYDIRWYRDAGAPHQIEPQDVFVTPEAAATYQTPGMTLWDSDPFQQALRKISGELESRRAANVKKSVEALADYPTSPSVAHLTEPERELLRRLNPAHKVLERLDIKLKDMRGLEFSQL